jgi:uncharacterized membrane protein YhiD involved in acid resistance
MKHGLSEFLHEVVEPSLAWDRALGRLGLALAAGFVVAGVYVLGVGRRREDSTTLPTTLVLLTVVIAVVTLVIGESIARAFGLVGALSIVRFRTVVEDTRDTAFVIFAVVVGMAVGAGMADLAAIGIPAVLTAALLMRWVNARPPAMRPSEYGTLTVRVNAGLDPEAVLGSLFAQHLAASRLANTSTAKQGAALEATYKVRMRYPDRAIALVADLSKVEGVQGVELKQS